MRLPFVSCFTVSLTCILALALQAAEPTRLDPSQPYQAQRGNAVTYDVDFSVVVTAPYKSKSLKVWLPVPGSDFGQEVSESELSSFPVSVTPQVAAEPLFGNRFAFFEFKEPQGSQIVRHRFKIKVWELRWNLKPEQVAKADVWPTSFDVYRRSESQAVVVNDRIRGLLAEVVPQRRNELLDLASAMDWANSHFTYDHVDASLRASSLHAAEKLRGHCSDYHGFCASIGRALGYPTRVTYGINTFPKNSPSHCKLEAFLPPYGWVSFDVSETQKLMADIQKAADLTPEQKGQLAAAARTRLLNGFRDNTWFLQTRGTDYDLVPKATQRVPVVRTIYAEADGVPLPDPDPANPEQREYAWMTVHQFTPDRPVSYPFKDYASLESAETPAAKAP